MNILFFITPKHEVAYLDENFTLRQALEKMEYHRYSAIPILNCDGDYLGTITEGDILWFIKSRNIADINYTENVNIMTVTRKIDYIPVTATSTMKDLISKALNQNFIPVTDDCNKFIGIITRKDIIEYYYNNMKQDSI